ncbi:MAG: response regulator [Spirochaetia bacterium]
MGYTISIVDDEPRVRKGLSKLISSRGEAWSACRLFSSGNAALEAARAERVDVILADIRMPGLDGLELAYALRTASPDTVVVIMSCYKEFDYARRAMKVGVLDFIVKPIEEEELFAVLDRARAEVERRKSDRLRAASAGDLGALKDALLTEALSSASAAEAGSRLCDLLDIHLGTFVILSAQILPPTSEDGPPLPSRAAMESALRREAHLFSVHEQFVALVPGSLPQAGEIALRLSALLGTRGRIGVSLENDGHARISAAFEQSMLALRPGYYDRGKALAFYEPWTARPLPYSTPAQDKLVACLVTGNRDTAETCARDFLAPLRQAQIPLQLLEEHVGAVIRHVLEVLSSVLPDHEEAQKIALSVTPILKHGWFDALEARFVEVMVALAARVEQANQYRLGRAVRRAVRFIEENYGRDLPLEEVAKSVGLSPSYFSSSFKRETGKNVVEYITEYRVEKAIELLCTTNLNTSEVAYRVGFNDPKYFTRIFKRSVGVTPSLYRRYSQEK